MIQYKFHNFEIIEKKKRTILEELFDYIQVLVETETKCKKTINFLETFTSRKETKEHKKDTEKPNTQQQEENTKTEKDEITIQESDFIEDTPKQHHTKKDTNKDEDDDKENVSTHSFNPDDDFSKKTEKQVDEEIELDISKKIYKKLSLHVHPDKGNTTNHFIIAKESIDSHNIITLLYLFGINQIDCSRIKLSDSEVDFLEHKKKEIQEKINMLQKTFFYNWDHLPKKEKDTIIETYKKL